MTSGRRQSDSPARRRKGRERERHRQEILDAAERVFAVRGFHATTMEEIARQSEFSVGSLYNFFANKEALFAELKESIAAAIMAEIERRVLRLDSPVEALGILVDLRMDFMERHRGLLLMVLEEVPGARWNLSRAMPKKSLTVYDKYIRILVGLFQRGIRSGVFDSEPSLHQALAFDGMVNALTLYWALHEGADLSREDVRAAVVNRFMARRGKADRHSGKGDRNERKN